MITGFNTDVEHEGVTYHVQTEDKGLSTPLILSLVYVGGTIVASKRSPYDDLIASGFNEGVLAERLQRQHRLLCAAIRNGRIEDLKEMTRRESEARGTGNPAKGADAPAPNKTADASVGNQPVATVLAAEADQPQPAPTRVTMPLVRGAVKATGDLAERRKKQGPERVLEMRLMDEKEFRAGEFITLRIFVSRSQRREAVQGATVTIKILGTSFKPIVSSVKTDAEGIATLFATLPRFTSGRAALLVHASSGGDEAELRRIIRQA